MSTQETAEAVFLALLDPSADPIESARSLGLSLTAFLDIAESPQVTGAIEALERIAQIRTRALLARSSLTGIAALERIAASDPKTPGAIETCRKAAAQLLRMATKRPETPEAARDTPPRAAPHEHRAPAEEPGTALQAPAPQPDHARSDPQPRGHEAPPGQRRPAARSRDAHDRYRVAGAAPPAPAQT